jgi:hypothetical protein
MNDYFRRFMEGRHIKGFIAGVISSTLVFGALSSAFLYLSPLPDDIDDYEFDYRGYGGSFNGRFDISGNLLNPDSAQTENVVLEVHERHRHASADGEVLKEGADEAWPTFQDAKDEHYFP